MCVLKCYLCSTVVCTNILSESFSHFTVLYSVTLRECLYGGGPARFPYKRKMNITISYIVPLDIASI
jgi:hypothetical protein